MEYDRRMVKWFFFVGSFCLSHSNAVVAGDDPHH